MKSFLERRLRALEAKHGSDGIPPWHHISDRPASEDGADEYPCRLSAPMTEEEWVNRFGLPAPVTVQSGRDI